MKGNSRSSIAAAFLILVVLVLSLAGCGTPGDPMLDDMYTRGIYPGTTDTYSVGSEDYYYERAYLGHLYLYDEDPFRLVGDAKVWIEFRPDLDFESVRAQGTPTWVTRGAFGGFSLPLYSAGEELFLDMCIPDRWDETTTIRVQIDVWLDTAQDAVDDAFRLQISYNSFTSGVDVVPNTFTDVEVETTTGVVAQYQTYLIAFDIPAGAMEGDDLLAFRLRRISVVTGNEIDGEVVVSHFGLVYRCDKLGNVTPE